jgi:predicted 3-demethylubiquinone-9 3-methyltransferase (glyoxalase superfamily)
MTFVRPERLYLCRVPNSKITSVTHYGEAGPRPAGMTELLNDPDPSRGQRAMKAMFGMKKLDLAALYAAADGA